MPDTLSDGRRFRVLVVVDDFTRECLALVVDTRSAAVVSHGSSTRLSRRAAFR